MRFALAVLLATSSAASAHDLFFRSPQYVLAPGARVVVDVLNGTFSVSENAITRDRLAGLALLGPGGRRDLDVAQWTETEPKSTLHLAVGEPGTYVLAAAIKPRRLELSGREFDAYLREEGLEDMVAARARQGRSNEPSRERYSKYLKALLQVGDLAGDAATTPLGHAAEIVPEQNPYGLKPGDRLTVRCLVDGKPWARKVVFAGGRRGATDTRFPRQRLVTDDEGRARVHLSAPGVWYVKLVALQEAFEDEVNYESKWATLSFALPARRD